MVKPRTQTARPNLRALRKWFGGQQNVQLEFTDLCKLLLVRVADRAAELVDEKGHSINTRRNRSYSYDLLLIAEDDQIQVGSGELQRAASYLQEHGWGIVSRRAPSKLTLTQEGMQQAEEIINDIFNERAISQKSWLRGAQYDLHEWLLVQGLRSFRLGKPFAEDGMVNFREVANQRKPRITDNKLRSALLDLEFRELIQRDSGPTKGEFWAYFNHGGEVAAELLEEIWAIRARLPAADRFVQLDDNSPRFNEAIASLESLVTEMREIRVNDWPEKEGMLTNVTAALAMLKTKYVNKTTILAAVSSVTAFLLVKFAEAPISELANKAWTAVKNLF